MPVRPSGSAGICGSGADVTITVTSIDYALKLTRLQWLGALNTGQMNRARSAAERIDQLLDMRCVASRAAA